MQSTKVEWGPCCFCGQEIAKTAADPCTISVTTPDGHWQTWFCHGLCFRQRLAPEHLELLEPVHF